MSLTVETECPKCEKAIDITMDHDRHEGVMFCENCGHAIRYRLSILIHLEDAV